jgi:SNF2 family DNA or RNA helicase
MDATNNEIAFAFASSQKTKDDVANHFGAFLKKANLENKPYQVDGVCWCVENETRQEAAYGLRGGLIADEMGLGKTITMIGTMMCNPKPKTLVVLPLALLDQWIETIHQLTESRPFVYHGVKNKSLFTLKTPEDYAIVVTTYAAISAQRFKKNKRQTMVVTNVLHDVQWDRVIFDEAHHMRNKNTSRNMGAKMLQTNIRWLITGTPIQNKKNDLYSLCAILGIPASVYTDPHQAPTIANHFLLKRTKGQAGIYLPESISSDKIVSWKHKEERNFSAKLHSLLPGYQSLDLSEEEEASICKNKPQHPPLLLKKYQSLEIFMRAKQCCVLPALLKSAILSDNVHHHSCALSSTSKIDALVSTLLSRRENGNGKLVFCHFREEINVIAQRLRDVGIQKVAVFDGRTSIAERNQVIRAANDVLILQIQTGCEGLNLQHNYSEIYFVTPHWNPSIEEQAIARCHRIGQTKPVFVFRFQMESFDREEDSAFMSFDQYVNLVQERKRKEAGVFFP